MLLSSCRYTDDLLADESLFCGCTGSAVSLALHWAFSSLISLYPTLLLPMLIQLARRRAGERVYEREVARIGSANSTAKPSRQLGFLVDRVRSAKVSTSSLRSMPKSPPDLPSVLALYVSASWCSNA
jgi:hypothetical protein